MKKLSGGPQQWFEANPSNISLKYVEFIMEMERIFAVKKNVYDIRKNLDDRKWKRGETFADYARNKIILAAELKLGELELLTYVIEGVQEFWFKRQLRIEDSTRLNR